MIGLTLTAVGLSLLSQGQRMAETMGVLVRDRPLMYIAGLGVLVCGLAIVLVHNRWSGGTLAVVVTILGWLTLIKGVILLLWPEAQTGLFMAAQFGRFFYVYGAIDLMIGIYLTVAGFRTSQLKPG